MMPIPGGWIITCNGSEIGRGTLAKCIAAGVENGCIEVEIRFATRTFDKVERHAPGRGVVIAPARMVERARRAA